ncbi:hypothetical protein BD770DRAFT_446169 [Pilaira anomala]|nr:hypothetical protein BD770DRAFT_446169 [Pilaira anomala]
MNRLGFRDFHTKHFGPEQKAHWQAMLQQQQQQQQPYEFYSQQPSVYDSGDQQARYDLNEYPMDQQYAQEPYSTEYHDDSQYDDGQYDDGQYDDNYEGEEELSKEAIEIFRFSEAYRKEREEERKREEVEDQEGMEDWQYDHSTVHVSGGLEAPATSLVLTKEPKEMCNKIKMKTELLNTAYLTSCTSNDDVPVILWPVLPFKM